jgi:hypothetical protein
VHYLIAHIRKADGKGSIYDCPQENCCGAAFLVVLFIRGVSPPPPLESRLLAGGVSTNATGFFFRARNK